MSYRSIRARGMIARMWQALSAIFYRSKKEEEEREKRKMLNDQICLEHKGHVKTPLFQFPLTCNTDFFFLTVLSQRGFSLGNSFPPPTESQLRQNCTAQSTMHSRCFTVFIIRRTLTSTTGSLKCVQMFIHAIALCAQGCNSVCGESYSGRKFPCRTGKSNLRQQRAGPALYQVSYIPISALR